MLTIFQQAYLQRPRGAGERASSVPAHRDEQTPGIKTAQWDPWAASLPASRELSGARRKGISLFLNYDSLLTILTRLDESVPSYMQVGGPTFGSRPSTPPRRSHDADSWTSSDLHGQAWGEIGAPFPSDDANLSPGKRRLGDLPRSTSPFHSLQETRHRQATAAQAAALRQTPPDSSSVEEPSRTLNDNTLVDRNRGRSLDMDTLAGNGKVDVFRQPQSNRSQRPFDVAENTGRTIRANILSALDDDYQRNNPVPRTRVHSLDPSFSLEPLQRANSTPPYSGPVPISSRDLPKSGLNPYPQSRTPQLQSSGHFTASKREDSLLTGIKDLTLESRPSDIGMGRRVSTNSLVSNLGTGYPSGINSLILHC